LTHQDFVFIFSVEAARTLCSPDDTRDVPGPVRVESTDQVQPVAVAPLVIVPPAQVVGPVPVPVAGPGRMVPGLVPVPARVVPLVVVPAAGPQVIIPDPAQVPTAPVPAPEPELPTVRSSVIVTEEDILAGEISRTVVRNGCESTRNGPVFFTRRKRLHKPTEFFGKPVPH